MFKQFTTLLSAPLFLFLLSCDADKLTEAPDPKAEEEVVWNWNAYPRSSELNLGTLRAEIQPKQSLEILSENSGVLTLNVDQRVTPVPKGYVWARMDVQALAEQQKRLDIQTTTKLLQTHKEKTIDIPEQKKEAREQIEEARRKVRVMEMVLRSPAMLEMSTELFGGDIGTVSEAALAKAKADLALIEKKKTFLDQSEGQLRADQAELDEMDRKKSERTLEEAKDRSVYVIPFDGELRVELNYVDGQKEYTIIANNTIATLNDYQEIHASLAVANAKWINLDPKTLYLKLQDRDKTLMSFLDDRVEREERTRKEERRYVFGVNLDGNEGLKRLTGTQMNAELVAKLPEPAYIVAKVDVSLYALGKTKTLDWAVMVDQLWPGAKVVAEGMKSLAIDFIPAQAGNDPAQ